MDNTDCAHLLTDPLVISPHFDDAVFGCGALLATCTAGAAVTVFAGKPADGALSTEWDARCGFANATEAIDMRIEEDRAALDTLGAQSEWLDFRDAQYGPSPDPIEIARSLRAVIARRAPSTLLMPFGLFHSDHLLTHDACLHLLREQPGGPWLAYEDALYRRMPGLLHARLTRLAQAGIEATPLATQPRDAARRERAIALKQHAIAAYASQLRAFGPDGYGDTMGPEGIWQLMPLGRRRAS